MKFNFFRSKPKAQEQTKSEAQKAENLEKNDDTGFTKSELVEYDKSVDFYYTNLINSLILFTYNSDELEKMESILIDPLTELYEELDYAFLSVCFETIFRNNIIDVLYKNELLNFKKQVDEIPTEIWDYEFIGIHEKWKTIKADAETLLNKLGISTRIFNAQYHKIITSEGKTVFNGQ